MLRIVENLGRGALFYNLTHLHDTNAVRNAAHDTKVVGDEQQAHAFAVFEIFQ